MAEQTEYLVRLMEATYQRASTVVRTTIGRTDRVLIEVKGSRLSESINSSEHETWKKRQST